MAWFESIRKWLSRRFRRRGNNKPPTIIRRYYSDKCVIFELSRATPGATGTYRIIAKNKQYQLLITFDSLREIEGEMVGKFDGESIYLRSRYKPPPLSHRFAIWRVETKTTCIACYDVSLEGTGNSGAIAPSRIARSYACYFLKNEFSESFDWLKLLERVAREYLPHHNLLALKRDIKHTPSDKKVGT